MSNKIETIVTLLDEKKADNIQAFDMRGKDYLVDDVIIASTLGQKHGAALLDYLRPVIRNLGEKILYTEESEEWTVIDLGDMMIHLMTPEHRSKYNIEEFLTYERPNLQEQKNQ
jgi:nicotinate-nucleotide adenylyltransferase